MPISCPPFLFTFLSEDIFNSDVVDANNCVHYVLRTPTANGGTKPPRSSPSRPSISKPLVPRPSLARRSARNPTIIVRPKSSSSEAKIVASLQWHHWTDSIFTTRWDVVRLEKMLPLRSDSERASPWADWSRSVWSSKGTWTWKVSPEGTFELRDASEKLIARFYEANFLSSTRPSHPPRLSVEFRALDMLDLIVTSLLVAVHEHKEEEPFFPSRNSAETIDEEQEAPAYRTELES
ncbi:hypothetical protein DL93DRAFT_2074401 [Clavulina sp. PMI_390]|nr:hypothetical protein DL93DRAFT_2074401 [Clavulina sp. PMI_390]